MLIEAHEGTGQPMNDKAVIDEVMTLIVAGHETTASTPNWVWYLLSENATVESRLHAEVDALSNEISTLDDLPKLIYAKQGIDETLHLYPPVWLFTHRGVSEDHIGCYYVAQQTDIIIVLYFVHRRPEFWEAAAAPRGAHLVQEASQGCQKFAYSRLRWNTGVGLASFFAMVEMQSHLSTVARGLRLRFVPERAVELEPHISLRSKHNLHMIAERR
jgi:enediyne biosynthesis protein E7